MADADVKRHSLFDVYREHYRWGLWMRLFYRCCTGACVGGAVGSLWRGEHWSGPLVLTIMALMFLCFNEFLIDGFIRESQEGMRQEAVRVLGEDP